MNSKQNIAHLLDDVLSRHDHLRLHAVNDGRQHVSMHSQHNIAHLLDDVLSRHHHLRLHAVNDGCQACWGQPREQHVVLDGNVCMKVT
jgi:uncharacterized membrane protein